MSEGPVATDAIPLLRSFFNCYSDPRDLHSFPTRRSSDLAELVSERKLEGIADLRDESDRNGMRILIELKRDRKSTRLNSSHMSISYAVFCLKKKKEKCHSEPEYAAIGPRTGLIQTIGVDA